jgi:RNA polymerase-binding transcription factor DksA
MADDIDLTTARAEIEDSIRNKYLKAHKPSRTDDCIECGVRIPEARQKATGGCDTCIYCQSLYEDNRKLFAR